MALNSTIYRFTINLSDMDRGIYETQSVHVALHPSETEARMVIRLLAYAINYKERLSFTKGLSEDAEPDLWRKSYSDEIEQWIEVGLPDAKRLKKAHNQSQSLLVYAYGGQSVDTWFAQVKKQVRQQTSTQVFRAPMASIDTFAAQLERTMELSIMIQDGVLTLTWADQMLDMQFEEMTE